MTPRSFAPSSRYTGPAPTIARNSYIDPRVIDLYESGTTIDRGLVTKRYRSPAAKQRTLEAAVLELGRMLLAMGPEPFSKAFSVSYLLEALRVLEGFDLKRMGHNRTDMLHVTVEALKLAMAADATLMGAVGLPEFDNAPPEKRPERGLLGIDRDCEVACARAAAAISSRT